MAGKTKKQGSRSATPRTPRAEDIRNAQLGHLGVKSSPFAPTDCKLVSQYMVRDRMAAHYKQLNKVKATVDCGPPKAYLVSQKLRDRARREAMKSEPRSAITRPHSARNQSLRESLLDEAEMQAMMESLSHYDDQDFHMVHYPAPRTSTSMEPHPSDSNSEMQFVNRMVNDTVMSPSKYSINKSYKSSIHHTHSQQVRRSKTSGLSTHTIAQKPLYKTQLMQTYSQPYENEMNASYHGTETIRVPSSGDVIDKHNEKFTEAKPFQPRIMKSNRQSKLSQFKYYTPPTKKGNIEENGYSETERGKVKQTNRSRPGTANTEFTTQDFMNETIVSRDFSNRDSPADVPKLNITLDGDNINWIKEQRGKAQVRQSTLKRTDQSLIGHTDLIGTSHGHLTSKNDTGLNRSLNSTYGFSSKLNTVRKMAEEEEELQYLEFIQDVTSDVLDRGIFTNRMLKQVFEMHVIKRRHKLDEKKMREKLEDLRLDLGIPESDADDYSGVGLTSTHTNSRAMRRARQMEEGYNTIAAESSPSLTNTGLNSSKKQLPNLHHTKNAKVRSKSPDSKPPIPKSTVSLDTKSQLEMSSTSLGKSQDLNDEDSVFGTITHTNTAFAESADILKVGDSEELGGTLNTTQVLDETQRTEEQTMAYQQQLQYSLDRSDSDLTESSLYNDSNITDAQRTKSDYDRKSQRKSDITHKSGSRSPDITPVNSGRPQSNDYEDEDFEENDSHRETGQKTAAISSHKQKKPVAKPRRLSGHESARSLDRTNTSLDTVEVSELDESVDDSDEDF